MDPIHPGKPGASLGPVAEAPSQRDVAEADADDSGASEFLADGFQGNRQMPARALTRKRDVDGPEAASPVAPDDGPVFEDECFVHPPTEGLADHARLAFVKEDLGDDGFRADLSDLPDSLPEPE